MLIQTREYYVIQDKQTSECISDIGETIDDIFWGGYYHSKKDKFVDCFKFKSLEEAWKTRNKFPEKSSDVQDIIVDDLIVHHVRETITQEIIENVKQEISRVLFNDLVKQAEEALDIAESGILAPTPLITEGARAYPAEKNKK